MNIIDKLALKIAVFVRKHNPDAGSEIALKYSASLLINTISATTISLTICAVTGHFWNGLAALFFFTLLRYVSGGFHLTSSLSCCLMTIGIMTLLAHADFEYWYLGFAFNILSILILLFKAPDGIEKISRIDPKYYPLLKVISVVLVASDFFIHSSLLSAVFLTQALTLLQVSYRVFDFIERRLSL